MTETFLLCWLTLKHVAVSERDQVDDIAAEAEDSSGNHDLRIHIVAIKVKNDVHPLHCRHHEGGDERPNNEDTGHCANDLSPMIAVRVPLVRLTQAVSDSNDTNAEAGDVREHVRSISHNRDRVRNVAANDFNDHEDEADKDYTAKLALRFFRVLQLLKEFVVLFNVHSVKLAKAAEAIRSSTAIGTLLIVANLVLLRHSFKLLIIKLKL